jgi:D-alanyl-lipoteichoic acid acyltransferase DltB (MBOAT superfamily)
MLFTTWQYAIFLPIVLVVYYALSHKWQNLFLLLASYYFYACWDPRFLLLLIFSTGTDYLCGLGIDSKPEYKKTFLFVTLAINLFILGFFKYFNFFISSAGVVLTHFHVQANMPFLKVILPVGVSFYTFQSISYVVDVYRGKTKAERNLLLYAVFVAYFPQLVAGPIERAHHMLPQYRVPRTVDEEKIRTGLMLILIGLFKKLAIADSVAFLVKPVFEHADTAPASQLLMGIWLFAIQIYCDFSGYTDIARGTSRLLGIELMENFNQPYFASNITEFWHRWHISLSTWLRDYLYIPLGGNRHGKFATYRNLFITMVLGGLWHGANWTYVIWGALHGVFLAIHKAFLELTTPDGKARPKVWNLATILSLVLTLNCVMIAWVFFRAPNFTIARLYLHGIFSLRGGLHHFRIPIETVAAYVALMLAIDLPQYWSRNHTVMLNWSWPVRGTVVAGMLLLIILLAPNNDTPFIYFQF